MGYPHSMPSIPCKPSIHEALTHKLFREPSWSQHSLRLSTTDHRLQHWLLDRGSLTSRLQHLSHGQLRVEILNQRWAKPRLSEARALEIDPHRIALIREVILCGNNEPWIYARSVLPQSTLTGRLRCLRQLDNRPLGALLFNDPGMRRSPIEIASFKADNPLIPESVRSHQQPLWARRSCFFLDAKPLLVSETFLPALVAKITS